MIITKEILDEKVPKNMMPTRLDSALNLYINVRTNDKSGLLVYNVYPDTWNLLYPFFEMNHKFTIDDYKFSREDLTYRELIEEYQNEYKRIYENEQGNTKDKRIKLLMDEFMKTFNLKDVTISKELTPIYELKYSKSKNVWTLYYFENYVATEVSEINDLVNQKTYPQEILALDSSLTEINGVGLASNIPYTLSIDSNLEILNNSIIYIEEKRE